MKNLSLATIAISAAALTSAAAMAAQPVELGRVAITAYADNGDVMEPATGIKFMDLFPSRYAAPSSLTREQVVAELAQSRANKDAGDLVEPATGQTLRALFPGHYPGNSAVVAKSRAEVRAEVAASRKALDAGDVVEPSMGQSMRALFPNRYPSAPQHAKTRDDVRTELAQAQRTGAMTAGHSLGADFSTGHTFAELSPTTYAGK